MVKPPKNISVLTDRLILDTMNPRMDEQPNQQTAILSMISNQGRKLIRLAEDIIRNGLSPASPFIVIPASSGNFVTLEGNRRLAVLKLLRDPELARDTPLFKGFSKLHRAHFRDLPQSVACVRLDNRDEANVWIERLHDRGLGGAGVEGWESEAKSRFQSRRRGQLSLEQRLIDEARKLSDLSEADRVALAGKVASTTIRRIIDDSNFRRTLGYTIKEENLIGTGEKRHLATALLQVVLDVAHKRVKVGKVYDSDGRREYLAELQSRLPSSSANSAAVEAWNVFDHFATAASSKNSARAKSKGAKSSVLRADRKRLIPTGIKLNTQRSKKASYLLTELSSSLVDDSPLLLLIGLRSFLEISCFQYQKEHKLKANDQMELHNRIRLCADHLESSGVATQAELKAARVVGSSGKDHAFSTNTLNAYVHNAHFVPKPRDVLGFWDQLEMFLQKLWA